MPDILFVCTANQFRSPIAVACLTRELAEAGKTENWQVSSAGSRTADGHKTHPQAVRAAKKIGLDVSGHRSREVKSKLLEAADLIIVMEQGHKEALAFEFPESHSKITLLTEFIGESMSDIPDPQLSNSVECDETAQTICEIIHQGFNELVSKFPD